MLIEKWWDEAREKVCGWAEDIKDGYEVNMTEVRELVDEMEEIISELEEIDGIGIEFPGMY